LPSSHADHRLQTLAFSSLRPNEGEGDEYLTQMSSNEDEVQHPVHLPL
jgi:hypothetical protein